MTLESFNGAQQAQISTMLGRVNQRFAGLAAQERGVITTLWTLIARSGMPVPFKHAHLQSLSHVSDVMTDLQQRGLLWSDRDMQAVLQCPPFSAIPTACPVKAFGWNPAYACSFMDAPLTLLLYGPNAWLEVKAACHETKMPMQFRVMLDDQHDLHIETPETAAGWTVWMPQAVMEYPPGPECVEPGIFATCDGFESYRAKHPDEEGVGYTFQEAIRFSEMMLRAYREALSGP